jgi:hypothetical protein
LVAFDAAHTGGLNAVTRGFAANWYPLALRAMASGIPSQPKPIIDTFFILFSNTYPLLIKLRHLV